MTNKKSFFFVVLGCVLMVFGSVFVGMYIWGAVISRSGEPDQSLLFWYLPILFIGVFGILIGAVVFWIGRHQIRQSKSASLHSTDEDA